MIHILVVSNSPRTNAILTTLRTDPELTVMGEPVKAEHVPDSARALGPDLILLDLAANEPAGGELVAELAQTGIPIVALAGLPAGAEAQIGLLLEAGAADVVTAPAENAASPLDQLPARLKAASRQKHAQDIAQESSKRATILIADDSSVQRRVIQHTLAKSGHVVLIAANGRDALDLALQQKPDLVILDYVLPELDGLSVLRGIRNAMLDTVVIMTTGHGSEEIAAAALQERADYYLIKPLVPWQLLNLVETSLAKQDARRRLSGLTQIYLRALDNLPLGVFIVDAAGRVKGWNRTMAELTGFDTERVMDRELPAACPFCAQLACQGALPVPEETGQRTIDEMPVITPSGERITLSLSLTYLEAARVTIGVVEDVTRRVTMRDRLVNAERMEALSKMVVTASHEINGPLTVILGSTQFLREEIEGKVSPEARADIDAIEQSVAKVQGVLRQMSQMARPQSTSYLAGVEMYDLYEGESQDESPDAGS